MEEETLFEKQVVFANVNCYVFKSLTVLFVSISILWFFQENFWLVFQVPDVVFSLRPIMMMEFLHDH